MAKLVNPPTEAHRVRVCLAHRDQSTFLSLVSTLHRRDVTVIEAQLFAPGADPGFIATFLASPEKARTVTASLSNLIHVLDADLVNPNEPVRRRTDAAPGLETNPSSLREQNNAYHR